MKRVNSKTIDINKRMTTFEEVTLNLSEEDALKEANRCLNCKKPLCVTGCPVGVNIPDFLTHIKNKEYKEAYDSIVKQNSFPGICGRVCPQEKQCEGKCVKGIKGESIAIGKLERFASTFSNSEKNINITKNGKKLAVIGSGPAGLSFASAALNLGFEVTIFEALHKAGGVLSYGIPEFRLPKSIVDKEINDLIAKGVILKTNYVIGKVLTLDKLQETFDGVFIATGAGQPRFMDIPGENLNGVLSANEFLTRINLMKSYLDDYDSPIKKFKNVAVVGGGNVAMDAARCAKRLGANVYLIYRRSANEMPARKEEIEHAIEEEIIFKTLTNPIKINSVDSKNVTSITCQKMELTEPDASGRKGVKPIEGSQEDIEVDGVIMAIGNFPNPLLKEDSNNLTFSNRGLIEVNESLETSIPFIYAGGDIVTGAATVISAMGAGKKAAIELYKKLFPENKNE